MLLRALGDVRQGFYVDVGAHDPRADSVTRAFYERGWQGINVEPVGHWFDRLVADRPRDRNLQVAAAAEAGALELWEIVGTGLSTADPQHAQRHRAEGREVVALQVPARTLDDILAEAGAAEVHFLKVDVEGFEGEVLRGLDLRRVRPWIVLVEATEPGNTRDAHHGWEPLLTGSGYDMVWFDGLNRFYLAQEHADRRSAFAAPPNVFDDFIRYSEWLARQDVATLRAECDRALDAAAAAQAHAASAEARLDEVYTSRSWRAAAPLRAFARLVRALRGRPAPMPPEARADRPVANAAANSPAGTRPSLVAVADPSGGAAPASPPASEVQAHDMSPAAAARFGVLRESVQRESARRDPAGG